MTRQDDIELIRRAADEAIEDWQIVEDVVATAETLRYLLTTTERDIRQRLMHIITTLCEQAGIYSVHGVSLERILRRVYTMNDDEVIELLDEALDRIHSIYTTLLRAARGEINIAFWYVPIHVYHAFTPWLVCKLAGHKTFIPCARDGDVECDDCKEDREIDPDDLFDDVDVD